MEFNICDTLCPGERKKLFALHSYSIKHHNKSYDYENNNRYRQNSKNSLEKCEKKVSKSFKPEVFLRKLYL